MIVITGATGNTGSVAAEALLAKGHQVRVIGRSADKLKRFTAKGAEAFVGDVLDVPAMARAFAGATAIYAMIPPDLTQADFPGYQARVADSLALAIEQAGVRYVVSLSSVGAQVAAGAGPISGLGWFEQRLNRVAGLNVLHLRPAFFFENFLMQIPAIQNSGIMGGSLRADVSLPMIATRDIGECAAEALGKLDFQGQQTRELLGPRDLTLREAAAILGQAIGRTLSYVQLPYEELEATLVQMGFSRSGAQALTEMYRGINEGTVRGQEPRSPENTTPTTLESFAATEFAPRFQGRAASA